MTAMLERVAELQAGEREQLRSAHNNAIEDCIAILTPSLMQDEDTTLALTAGRWIEKMRALKRFPPPDEDRAARNAAIQQETAMTMKSLKASDQAIGAHAVAPRVTLDDIKRSIKARYDVRGYEAVGFTADDPGDHPSLGVLTLCILVLHNGWTVVGKSAPASTENFNADLGKDLAFKDAVTQIWPLMGFELRCRLHQLEQAANTPKMVGDPPPGTDQPTDSEEAGPGKVV